MDTIQTGGWSYNHVAHPCPACTTTPPHTSTHHHTPPHTHTGIGRCWWAYITAKPPPNTTHATTTARTVQRALYDALVVRASIPHLLVNSDENSLVNSDENSKKTHGAADDGKETNNHNHTATNNNNDDDDDVAGALEALSLHGQKPGSLGQQGMESPIPAHALIQEGMTQLAQPSCGRARFARWAMLPEVVHAVERSMTADTNAGSVCNLYATSTTGVTSSVATAGGVETTATQQPPVARLPTIHHALLVCLLGATSCLQQACSTHSTPSTTPTTTPTTSTTTTPTDVHKAVVTWLSAFQRWLAAWRTTVHDISHQQCTSVPGMMAPAAVVSIAQFVREEGMWGVHALSYWQHVCECKGEISKGEPHEVGEGWAAVLAAVWGGLGSLREVLVFCQALLQQQVLCDVVMMGGVVHASIGCWMLVFLWDVHCISIYKHITYVDNHHLLPCKNTTTLTHHHTKKHHYTNRFPYPMLYTPSTPHYTPINPALTN